MTEWPQKVILRDVEHPEVAISAIKYFLQKSREENVGVRNCAVILSHHDNGRVAHAIYWTTKEKTTLVCVRGS